jgi:hypothetical protein
VAPHGGLATSAPRPPRLVRMSGCGVCLEFLRTGRCQGASCSLQHAEALHQSYAAGRQAAATAAGGAVTAGARPPPLLPGPAQPPPLPPTLQQQVWPAAQQQQQKQQQQQQMRAPPHHPPPPWFGLPMQQAGAPAAWGPLHAPYTGSGPSCMVGGASLLRPPGGAASFASSAAPWQQQGVAGTTPQQQAGLSQGQPRRQQQHWQEQGPQANCPPPRQQHDRQQGGIQKKQEVEGRGERRPGSGPARSSGGEGSGGKQWHQPSVNLERRWHYTPEVSMWFCGRLVALNRPQSFS